ncbi:hypothetical protein B0H11DRAFT_2031175 [Mycena galericulata]|nr:hypothetical protein B0H11DRAFT_2031175 [Mycena galericulata]
MNRKGSRMRAVHPALRQAFRNQHRSAAATPAVADPVEIQPILAQAPEGGGDLAHSKHRLTGEKPFFNDWESSVVDHKHLKVYRYGGVRPYDGSDTPTCDFHCLDATTMKWKNLTDSLRFRPRNYSFDPFLKDEAPLEQRQLPALIESACTLVSLGGGTFFLLFGGHDGQNPTSDLIAIDLDLLIWWFVDVQGTQIRPRMAASLVAIGNQLFIFGGRDQFGDNAAPIATYSTAKYEPRTRWTWTVSDQPMPPDLPLLGYNIQATPVYDGQKILLAQGRIHNEKPIELSRASTIFFHTQHHTFQDARGTVGNFPEKIAWYQLASLVAGAPTLAPVSPRRRPGRPPKNPSPETPIPPHIPTNSFPPSVVIFAWVRHSPDDDALVPEAWQYFLPPTERIRCLNLCSLIWDLNLDLRTFVAVGNQIFLMGSEQGFVEDDQMMVDRPVPRVDVAIEISSQYLAES